MNAAGDYSSAYCILHTDSDFKGHGMVREQALLYSTVLCALRSDWVKNSPSSTIAFYISDVFPSPSITYPSFHLFITCFKILHIINL